MTAISSRQQTFRLRIFAETVVPYGPLLRKIAINLVRRHQTSKASLKGRRLMGAWDNRCMEQVLTGIFHA